MNDSNTIYPLIIHFDANDPALTNLIGPPASMDWCPSKSAESGGLNRHKFAELVCHACGFRFGETVLEGGQYSYSNACGDLDKEGRERLRLYGYTGKLVEEAISGIGTDFSDRIVLAVNLLCFVLQDEHLDQILQAVEDNISSRPQLNQKQNLLLLMIRNPVSVIAMAGNSMPVKLKEFIGRPSGMRVMALDYDRRMCYSLDKVDDANNMWRMPIHNAMFYQALNINESKLASQLVFGTNMQIGHFVLENAHIRTHYDIREFVRRDSAREAVFHMLDELFKELDGRSRSRRCIVVQGIHELELYRIADAFVASGGANCVVAESELECARSKTYVEEGDKFVILSDIVYTGTTIERFAKRIKNRIKKPLSAIKLLSIARMKNSPDTIGNMRLNSLVVVNRLFFHQDNCPICRLKQPDANNGHQVSLPDMFRHNDTQLTPLDFWELVGERRALHFLKNRTGKRSDLRVSKTGLHGKRSGIIVRYRTWIKSIIKERLLSRQISVGSIDAIVTIDDGFGNKFSHLIAESLDLTEEYINCVKKEVLTRPPRVHFDSKDSRVLIALSDIVSGNTLEALCQYCELAEISIVVTFDSRLKEGLRETFEDSYDITHGIMSLYSWEAGGDAATAQLAAMLTNWGNCQCDFSPIGAMADYAFRTGKSISSIFDMNAKLYYDVFRSSNYLSDDDSRTLVRLLSDEKQLSACASSRVKRKYETLSQVAEEVLAGKDEDDITIEMQDASSNEDESIKVFKEAGDYLLSRIRLDRLMHAVVVPIFRNRTSDECIGTGFLVQQCAEDVSGLYPLFLITCHHVSKQTSNSDVVFIYDEHYYAATPMNVLEDSSALDLAIYSISGLSANCLYFCSKRFRRIRKHDICEVRGYTKKSGSLSDRFDIECKSDNVAQSGVIECRIINVGNKDVTRDVVMGLSGSPVFDKAGYLVGMISERNDLFHEPHAIAVLPANTIFDYISGKRGLANEQIRTEP